ncbi:HNH endonuclease [Stutzerimonas stutzeri ATCC 17588 = LMG 11199]|nr:HNH endonuclease [Stutzerimonas stutzeri ATCC 17588 = LMG 11199]
MRQGWTDEELLASLDAYAQMAAKDQAGEPYSKVQTYRDLAGQFGRSEKAFEYRMQNISALYAELGLNWVTGLMPAANIGADVKQRLMQLMQSSRHAQPLRFKYGQKPQWELVFDAVIALGGSASRQQVRSWIVEHHPTYNEKNLVDLEMLSVNSPSRTSYQYNSKPRRSDTDSPYDKLFKIGRGVTARFETYYPALHGVWEIYQDTEAKNRYGMAVRQATSPASVVEDLMVKDHGAIAEFCPQNVIDGRQKTLAQIYRRKGQPKFRRSLLTAYQTTCAISGCKLEPILEAAHIHPYKGDHTNVTANGLLLRADIHTLFDLNLISVDARTLSVEISPELLGTEYANLVGKPLRAPSDIKDRPSIEALAWHRDHCNW